MLFEEPLNSSIFAVESVHHGKYHVCFLQRANELLFGKRMGGMRKLEIEIRWRVAVELRRGDTVGVLLLIEIERNDLQLIGLEVIEHRSCGIE